MSHVRHHIGTGLVVLLLFSNFVIWQAVFTDEKLHELTIAFLDIGQGDAIYIEAPNGNQMLIDGGPNGKILSELAKLMPFGDRSIDVMVVTNPDADHYAGFIDVLQNYDVAKVIEPGTVSNTQTYRRFESAVIDEGAEKIIARRGMRIFLSEEVSFDVLFPDRDVTNWNTNDGSIVGKLVYASTSIMFTGDATKRTEGIILGFNGVDLKSDVLKVGHHGSRTSTGEQFVRAVAPAYAVISLGKGNRYGHPHRETLNTLHKFGVQVFRADEQGTIQMTSDGEAFFVR